MTKIPTKGKLHVWGTDDNGEPFNNSVDIVIEETTRSKERRYNVGFAWPGQEEQWLGRHPRDGIWPAVMRALSYGYRNCNVEHLNLSWFYDKEEI